MRSDKERIEAQGVRNLDEIQEDDPGSRPSRIGALVLASIGGAAIVFAAAALMRSPARPRPVNADPLGDLVARARPGIGASQSPGGDAIGHDVTFPGALSDAKNPTTAFESVRDHAAVGAAGVAGTGPGDLPFTLPAGAPTLPPSAADRLPVVPLPAQDVLRGTPDIEPAAGDTLATMAKHLSRDEGAETAPSGQSGGYQLQVSSFKTQKEGEAFAAALRRRGHKAYVEPANVPGRGLWYRVRVGPFKYRRAAVIYRQEFETKERMVTFIVDPPKEVKTVAVRMADE